MSTRNMETITEKARPVIPANYDMTVPELNRLMGLSFSKNPNDVFKAIETAFTYGFALGSRAAKAGKVKRI